MEDMVNNFFDNYEDGFLEYLEAHKTQALKDREDYQTLNKKISELKYKYPNVRTFLEEKEPIEVGADIAVRFINEKSRSRNCNFRSIYCRKKRFNRIVCRKINCTRNW